MGRLGILTVTTTLLLAACTARSERPIDASAGALSDGALHAEALSVSETGAALDGVAAEPSGDFLAIGTKFRESPPGAPTQWHQEDLFAVRVHGATVERTSLPELADSLPGGASFTTVTSPVVLGLDERGDGFAAGTFIAATPDGDGFRGSKTSFVVEYRAGTWTMLPVESLPLVGAFRPVAVTCSATEGCLFLVNRSPGGPSSDSESSMTVLRRKGAVWSFELDERETDHMFEPRGIAQRGSEILVVGQATDLATGTSRGVAWRKRDGQWTPVTGVEGDTGLFGTWAGPTGISAVGRGTTSSVQTLDGEKLVRRAEHEARLFSGVALAQGSELVVGERSLSPGYLPFVGVVTSAGMRAIDLPGYTNPSGIRAIAARGNVAVGVGAQSIEAGAVFIQNPLLVRIAPTEPRGEE